MRNRTDIENKVCINMLKERYIQLTGDSQADRSESTLLSDAIRKMYRIDSRAKFAVWLICNNVMERLENDSESCYRFTYQLKADSAFLNSGQHSYLLFWARWRECMMKADDEMSFDNHAPAGIVQMLPKLYQMIEHKFKLALNKETFLYVSKPGVFICYSVIRQQFQTKSCDKFLGQIKDDTEILGTDKNFSHHWTRWRGQVISAVLYKKQEFDLRSLCGIVQMVDVLHPLLYQMIQHRFATKS